MTTQHRLTDAEWLASFEAGEVDFDTSHAADLTDLAEVRAFELLRREYEAAIIGSIRLSRHRGTPWAAIAAAVHLTEAETIGRYRGAIGEEAETAAVTAPVGSSADARSTAFLVRCRDDAVHRLTEAIGRARAAGIDDAFIESVRVRSDEGARFAWPLPS